MPAVTDQQVSIDFNERVGANVQRFRKAAGVSQAELARQLSERGFSFQQPTVLKVEKGSRPLKADELAAIAEILHIAPGSLFEQVDERLAALDQLRAAEAAITRLDRERDQYRQTIERLDQEIAENERLKQQAAEQLIATFTAEGRPDLARFYTDPKPADNVLAAAWRKARNG
jgi:transcriptional regulator with XRE-family HTH domain